jgi:hypothetical protein
MATVTIREETFPGGQTDELTLEFLTERVTVRELIRGRVYQTVTEHRARHARPRPDAFQPSADERLLNGPRPPRRIDWEAEYERALQAFHKNGVLILVDDRQVTDLDEEVELRADTRVTFLRLVPLAGG